ncbi:MAG: CarD family transcriptional regulator [Syntrophomonadaceae bacterium]|nr:transcriptional regulator [Syntrophomonadaceae bacterium]
MFKVNDYVMYGSTGVCKIIDISKEKHISINSEETDYYVLHPVFNDNIVIKIAVNNPNAPIRAILTKDEVLSLIKTMPEQETIWIDDNRERSEYFKAILKSKESEDWVKLIKTLFLEKEARSLVGKTLTKTDEGIMNTVEKLLYEEFAIALGISPDEVLAFIEEYIPK